MKGNIFTKKKEISESSSLDELLFASLEPGNESYFEEHGFHTMQIDYGGRPLLFVSAYELYPEPRRAHTPISKAMYLGWKKEERNGFLIQYLPPNAITSKHHHEEQTEIFHVLEGEFVLDLHTEKKTLHSGESYIVEPGVIHQLSTEESPSLTIIEMHDVNYKDHVLWRE